MANPTIPNGRRESVEGDAQVALTFRTMAGCERVCCTRVATEATACNSREVGHGESKLLILLVGAARFELATPCAQDGNLLFANWPILNYFTLQAVATVLL